MLSNMEFQPAESANGLQVWWPDAIAASTHSRMSMILALLNDIGVWHPAPILSTVSDIAD